MSVGASAPAVGRAGPGRPSTGARERILAACLEVLKESGFAGLSIAKVAARAGESKALIAYHFDSKDGLIEAAARELGQDMTTRILGGLDDATTIEEIVRGAAAGMWAMIDTDERLPRVYFDLNAVSVVDPGIRDVLREIKEGWRAVLSALLRDARPAVPARDTTAAATLIIAGLEGLCLERIERGETPELRRAAELFVTSTATALGG